MRERERLNVNYVSGPCAQATPHAPTLTPGRPGCSPFCCRAGGERSDCCPRSPRESPLQKAANTARWRWGEREAQRRQAPVCHQSPRHPFQGAMSLARQGRGERGHSGSLPTAARVLTPSSAAVGAGPWGKPLPAAGRPMAAEVARDTCAHNVPGPREGQWLCMPSLSHTPAGRGTPVPNSCGSELEGKGQGLCYLRAAGADEEGSLAATRGKHEGIIRGSC